MCKVLEFIEQNWTFPTRCWPFPCHTFVDSESTRCFVVNTFFPPNKPRASIAQTTNFFFFISAISSDCFVFFCVFYCAGLVAELKSQIPVIDEHFQIHHRIGEGTFSTVFLTSLRRHEHVPPKQRRFFALKYLVPTSHPKRIAQELKCLQQIG